MHDLICLYAKFHAIKFGGFNQTQFVLFLNYLYTVNLNNICDNSAHFYPIITILGVITIRRTLPI